MKLFEIDHELMRCVDAETGEVFDIERFEELSMQREAKLEGICCWIKNLKAEEAAYKAEKDSFAKREAQAKKQRESLQRFLAYALDGNPFKSTKANVYFRKSEYLDITEGAYIPEEYLRYSEPEVNKKDLTEAVKNGLHLPGVSIGERNSIIIK